MESILKINNLNKKYGNFYANKNININIQKNDIYGLIGRNGAGKTTLLKMIMGLSKPSSGEVLLFNGKTEKDNMKNRKKVGFYIGQSFYPYLNGKDNLKYYSKLKGINNIKEIDEILELVGLKGVTKPFKSYSMGMKQRLGLGVAMLGNPELIVLDEPINGLDPQGIVEIRKIIKYLNENNNTTLLVSSHILSELDIVANRFGIIDHGELVKEITFNELHNKKTSGVIVKVDNIEKSIKILKEKLNIEKTNTIDDTTLEVNSKSNDSNIINKVLINNNIGVFEIYKTENSLEDYYFSLVGGKKND